MWDKNRSRIGSASDLEPFAYPSHSGNNPVPRATKACKARLNPKELMSAEGRMDYSGAVCTTR